MHEGPSKAHPKLASMAAFTYSFSTGPLRLLVSVDGVHFLSFTPNNPRLLVGHLRANPGATRYDAPNGEFSFGLNGNAVEWVSVNYTQDAFGNRVAVGPVGRWVTKVDPSFYRMLEDIAKL